MPLLESPTFSRRAPCGHRAGTVRAPRGHRAGTVAPCGCEHLHQWCGSRGCKIPPKATIDGIYCLTYTPPNAKHLQANAAIHPRRVRCTTAHGNMPPPPNKHSVMRCFVGAMGVPSSRRNSWGYFRTLQGLTA